MCICVYIYIYIYIYRPSSLTNRHGGTWNYFFRGSSRHSMYVLRQRSYLERQQTEGERKRGREGEMERNRGREGEGRGRRGQRCIRISSVPHHIAPVFGRVLVASATMIFCTKLSASGATPFARTPFVLGRGGPRTGIRPIFVLRLWISEGLTQAESSF